MARRQIHFWKGRNHERMSLGSDDGNTWGEIGVANLPEKMLNRSITAFKSFNPSNL